MANINFDDGFESFTINNDPSRVIRINPKDTNIVARFEDVMRDLKTESSQIAELEVRADGSLVRSPGKSYEEGLEHLKKFNQLICEKLNYIFNADVSDVVFGKQSPLSLVGPENRFLFEVFLEAALNTVKERLDSAAQSMDERMGKYLGKYKEAESTGEKYPFPVK